MSKIGIVRDLTDQVAVMRFHGSKGPFVMRCPKTYVQALLDELREGGLDLGDAQDDSAVRLELNDGTMITVETSDTIEAHGNV